MNNALLREKQGSLNNLQLYSIISRFMLGAALFGAYRIVAEKAGRDAWISILLTGIVVLLASLMIVRLNKRFPNDTFVQYAEKIVGKLISRTLSVIMILYFLAVTGLSLRLAGELVTTWILPDTPLLIIMSLLLAAVLYMTRNGLLVLGRYCTLITILMLFIPVLVMIPSTKWMINNILPVGERGISGILSGLIPSLYAYQGYEALLLLYPYVQKKEKATRTVLLAVMYTVFSYLLMMLAVLLYFGSSGIQYLLYPPLIYLQTFGIPVIERLDLFTFFFALFSISAGLGVGYMMTSLGIVHLFNVYKRKSITLALYPLILLIAWLPVNISIILDFYTVIGYFNLFIGMVIPLLLLIISNIRKVKGGEAK